jgi:hypothetical protein
MHSLTVCALVGSMFPLSVRAQSSVDARWAIDEPHWSGLQAFAEALRGRGHVVRQSEGELLGVPWAGDTLVLLAPSSAVDRRAIEAWTGLGGGLVLAHDQPAGGALFRAYGVRLSAAASCPAPRLLDRCGLPVATRTSRVGELDGIEMLALNRPMSLRGGGIPMFAIGDAESVVRVVESEDGSNRVVLASDPSLWINLMLPLLDNEAFAVGGVELACGEARCDVLVVAGDTRLAASDALNEAWAARSSGWRDRLERGMRKVFDARVGAAEARWLAALLAAMIAIQLAFVLPRRRPKWIEAPIVLPRGRPLGEFGTHLKRQLDPRADLRWEAATLLRAWRSVGGRKLPIPAEPGWRARNAAARTWARAWVRDGGAFAQTRAARRFARVLRALEHLPSVGRLDPPGGPLQDYELDRLHRDLVWTLEKMGLDGERANRSKRPA